MKRATAMLLLVVLSLVPVFGFAKEVKGFKNKKGKWVAPYYRTPRNKLKGDNYSTKGQINPSTGKKGTKPLSGM